MDKQQKSIAHSVPSDEHTGLFSELVASFPEEAIAAVEIVFAKELPTTEKRKLRESLESLARSAVPFAERVNSLKNTGDMVGLAKVAEEYIRAIIPQAGSSPFDYLLSALSPETTPIVKYILDSKYSDYLVRTKEIISNTTEIHPNATLKYMQSVQSEINDIQSWGQFFATDMGKIVKYLAMDRKRFSKGLASRCIQEYGKMSGVYEQLIRILAGFSAIGSPDESGYKEFADKSLSINIKRINAKGWSIFSDEFDTLLRNSIAHKSWKIRPKEKTALFIDRGKLQEELSYQQIFEKTRRLSCLVLALGQFPSLVQNAFLIFLSSKNNQPVASEKVRN